MKKIKKFLEWFDDSLGRIFPFLLPIGILVFAGLIGLGMFSPVPSWVAKDIPAWVIHSGFFFLAAFVAFLGVIFFIKRKTIWK